jgi:aryl-alcohol dehydrogenase-like predicted oxidoreductase
MEKRPFGKTGMHVSVLGFGGAEIGFRGATPKDVERLLNSALDAGLNVIDTAECYMNSEELIGQAVSHRRKDFYLFTKVGHSRGYDDPDWDKSKRLEESLERSLKNLKTDHLDLLQLHSCTKEVLQRGAVIEFLKRAQAQGKTRFIGYSGDREDAAYAVESGAFDSLQTSISVADQEAITLTVPKAVKNKMGIIAERPIANVMWSQKESGGAYYEVYWDRFKKLRYDFQEKDLKTAVGVALRFTLSVPGVCTAIVGTMNPGRWQENAALLKEGALPKEQFNAIRQRWQEVAAPDWVGQT